MTVIAGEEVLEVVFRFFDVADLVVFIDEIAVIC